MDREATARIICLAVHGNMGDTDEISWAHYRQHEEGETAYEAADAVIAALSPGGSVPEGLDAFDAGLLSDFGGGNVSWWQDYIRQLLGSAHDHYEAQIAASPPTPVPVEGWRDIATAPKDGTHILACIAGTSFGWMNMQPLPPVQTVVHWWDAPGEEGFYLSAQRQSDPDEAPFEATHWKPLDAPTPQGEGGGR